MIYTNIIQGRDSHGLFEFIILSQMVDDGKKSRAFRLLKIALGCLLHDSPDKGSLCGFAYLRGLLVLVTYL